MLMLDPKRLRRLRRLSVVPRWTVLSTIRKQNVAEHSYHVAHIALWVAHQHLQYQNGELDKDLMWYALVHDESEAITGDIPSPAGNSALPGKSKEYEIRNKHGAVDAPEDVKKILKIADLLEAYLFILEEMELGNKSLEFVRNEIHGRLSFMLREFPMWNGHHWSDLIADFVGIYSPKKHPVLEPENDDSTK